MLSMVQAVLRLVLTAAVWGLLWTALIQDGRTGIGTDACIIVNDGQLSVQQRYFYHGNKELTITLEDSGRISHRIANRILKILLQDVAGYKKVDIQYCPLYDKQNITALLDRVSGRMASKHCQPPVPNVEDNPETHVYLEAWVVAEFNKAPWLVRRAGSPLPQYIIDSGPLGPQGRMGWYIPTYMVQALWNSSQIVVDHWRALQLTRINRKLSWWGREELVSFKSDYKTKVYRNRRCLENAKGRRRNCATLFAGHKGMDGGILESQIEALELDVDIVWMGDQLDDFVTQRVRAHQPVLFFNWHPNYLIASGRFTRVNFPEIPTWNQKARNSNDFPVNRLTKVTWAGLKTGAPEAFYIIRNMFFTDQEYNNLVGHAVVGVDKVACDWVNSNQAKWKRWLPRSLQEKPKIYLGGLFPLTGKSWSQPGLVEGANLALDLINRNDSILPNHTLELKVKDTQCQYDLATNHFISFVQDRGDTLAGILGPGCSDPAERVASLSKNFHLLTVSYGAEAEALSDRSKYPYFFRTVPPIQRYSQVYPDLFRELGWGLVGALAEDGQKLPDYHLTLQDRLQHHGISLIVKRKYLTNSSSTNISQILHELKRQKVHVIIADVFSHVAREIMCEAFKQEMTAYHGYIWFLPSWYPDQWWDVEFYNGWPSHLEQHSYMENVPCKTDQLLKAIEGHFILSKAFTAPPEKRVVGGITVKEYKDMYALRCGKANVEESNFASFVYDAVWVFAKGLHSMLSDNQGALKTLHTKETAKVFKKAVQEVKFMGVSGEIWFDKSDRNADLIMLQFFSNETRVIGHYIPNRHADGDKEQQQHGELKLDLSAIKWLSPLGPGVDLKREVKEDCLVETFRASLNSSCLIAIFIIIIIPVVLICLFVLLVIFLRLRKRVKLSEYKVTHDRMKELGLLKEDDQILLLDDWEVPRKDIVLNRELGEGAFGTVMGGEMCTETGGWVSVAVKTLKSDFRVEEKLEFLSEVNTMKKLKHPNVVQLLGVCTREVVFAIMEFMLHGNLKTFLLSRRHLVGQGVKEAEDTKPERLAQMTMDVAMGLDYLHGNKFVHRDLACRNCLVHANKTVKIGDFGMTRHMSDTDIYRFARKGMLPVRWTAPESLKDGIYTAKSDIWSFGVLAFEIVTFGSFPYQGMSNKEVLDYVGRGLPLPLPDQCPRDLQTFIKWCMSPNPDFRPDLTAILTELQHSNASYLIPCLDAPAFSVEHEDTDSLEILVSNTQIGYNHNAALSMLPFSSSNSSRMRSHSLHDKPGAFKKKNFAVPGFTSLASKMGRTSTSSRKTPTSSRSSSRCSEVITSNSMTCGIHACGIGAGWSHPFSGTVGGNIDSSDRQINAELLNTWNSGGHHARADDYSVEFSEDLCNEKGSGVIRFSSGMNRTVPTGGGSCSDGLEQLASSCPPHQGSHRSLNSLRSHSCRNSSGLNSDRKVMGSSVYLSQNSRAEAKQICQTVTSL